MKFPVSTSSNFGQPTFLSSSSSSSSSQSFFGVLAKLLCIYACFFLDSLVSYNGASNSWGLFVIEKFAVLLYLIQPSFSSSFVLLRSCIPIIKITPLLRQAYKLPFTCIIYILRGGGVCYSSHLVKYKYRQSKWSVVYYIPLLWKKKKKRHFFLLDFSSKHARYV